VYLST
jgi:protein transport protein SEC23